MESVRLIFRELNISDAARLFEIYSDKEAMKYRQSNHHKTIDDSFEMLKRDAEVKASNYEHRYGIIEKDSKQLIGTIMYQPIYNKAIIGYSFAKQTWGNGFATEVVDWMINYLKQNNFRIIEAWVLNENIASSKVLEKNNFRLVSQTIYPESKFYQLYV